MLMKRIDTVPCKDVLLLLSWDTNGAANVSLSQRLGLPIIPLKFVLSRFNDGVLGYFCSTLLSLEVALSPYWNPNNLFSNREIELLPRIGTYY